MNGKMKLTLGMILLVPVTGGLSLLALYFLLKEADTKGKRPARRKRGRR